jgi:serine phosphatase RsbU (regulator of sigma subunit)
LVISITTLVLLSAGAVMLAAFLSSATVARTLADSLFREASNHAVTRARNHVLGVTPVVNALARIAAGALALDDSDRLALQLVEVLKANEGLSWASYSDESGSFTGAMRTPEGTVRLNQSRIEQGRTRLVERDVLPDGSLRVFRTDDDNGYDPRTRPFYRLARSENRLVWLPPYVFFGQNLPGITAAAPVRDTSGRFLGVFTADFDLNAMSAFFGRLTVSPNSRFFLFTDEQILLAHPGTRVVTADDSRSAGTRPAEARMLRLNDVDDGATQAYRAAAPALSEIVGSGSGPRFTPFRFRHDGQDYLASATAFRVDRGLTWVVGAYAPEEDFLGGVRQGRRIALAIALGAVLLAVLIAVALSRHVSRPVLNLAGFMRKVGAGDLEQRLELRGPREFRQLSETVNRMLVDLRDGLRLRQSLQLAMEVQQRLLPAAPPKVLGLDLAGHSTYCDETGGDYYDFLVVDQTAPHAVMVALGDVMGHGIAAALVMAGARAVLRDRATVAPSKPGRDAPADADGSLAGVLDRINRLISNDLGGTKFMTLHLSVIDTAARTFRFASAGHDPAIIYDAGTDTFHECDEGGGLPLGITEDGMYDDQSFAPLRPGMVLTVGTDGVWEMLDESDEQFGKDRLREVIRASASGAASDISRAIVEALRAFRGTRVPADDVTFVVAKVLPG